MKFILIAIFVLIVIAVFSVAVKKGSSPGGISHTDIPWLIPVEGQEGSIQE